MFRFIALFCIAFLSWGAEAKPKMSFDLASLKQQEITDVEGTLFTLCSMPKNKTDQVIYLYHIKTSSGEYIPVFFPENSSVPESGSKVRLKRSFKINGGKGLYATGAIELMAAPVFKYDGLGVKNVLVNLVNYADKPGANKATVASYTSLYKQVKDGFWSQSFNNIAIESNIQDNVVVPQKSTDACDGTFLYGLIDEVKKQATAKGLDLNQFAHIQMILPPTNGCGWCGLGSVGGPYTWINAWNSYSTVGHELGHNFGLMHSNAYTGCDSNWKNCTNQEYGDGASLQGVAEGEFTAVHKSKLKWLDNISINPQTLLVTQSGSYSIEPLETQSTNVKALKFERTPGEFYYVEFRKPLNYDSRINTMYHKMLGIHLLMNNSTASWRLKNVGVGQSFVDPSFPGGGLTISLVSYNANGANINVQIGGIVPPTVTPTVIPPTVIPPTVTPTVVPTVVPTNPPTVTPTATPTVTPGNVVFKIIPGQSVYKYDPSRTIWSSVSTWITKDGKPQAKVNTNYNVKNSSGKTMYQISNRATDGNGYVKYGLPIDKNFVPGKYTIKIIATINGKSVAAPFAYFDVKED